jgi:hypothetical protein
MHTSLLLTIKNRPKAIPYPSGEHDDGSKNHGFKPLKAVPEDVETIPEAQDNDSLKLALKRLNARRTPFFTVGCEKAYNKSQNGCWARGYLEFSFNYVEIAADPDYYFRIFFGFNQYVWEQQEQKTVQYHFELEPAHYMERNADGYTCSVWITTAEFPEDEQARSIWGSALDTLVGFLEQVPGERHLTAIY